MSMKISWRLLFFIAQTALAASTHPQNSISQDADSINQSVFYVHKWISMPEISGKWLFSSPYPSQWKTPKGHIQGIYFMASWCTKCLEHLPRIQKIEKSLSRPYVRWTYIFVHDTENEAKNCAKKLGLNEALLGSEQVLKNFKNPKLPTFYLSDREGWMLERWENFSESEFYEMENVLKILTENF